MADTRLYIKNALGELVPVDTRTVGDGDTRQVLLIGDGENAGLISPATEGTLSAVLAAVQSRLVAGDAVELGPAALAALENITVGGTVEVDNATGGALGVKQTGVAPPRGYAQASVTAAQALPTVPANTVTALVVPRAPIRWRDDAINPTAAVGMYLAADQPLEYRGDLAAFRMIAVTGTAEVNVSFYGAET